MSSRHWPNTQSFLLAFFLFLISSVLSHAQFGPVYWRDAQSPYTPGDGAISGGPGSDPNPNSPMYICRARFEGSTTPGKWVKGNCNIAFGGKEQVMNTYQVAYGDAVWQPYSSTSYGLVRTGNDRDGTPLYSCRVRYNPGPMSGGDQGYQPGKLLNGVLIKINEEELENLRIREKNYDTAEVSSLIKFMNEVSIDPASKAFTFVGKDDFKINQANEDSFIMNRYVEIVLTACASLGESFRREYDETTEPAQFRVIDGNYSFVDIKQSNYV